jgi:MFS family permease
MVLGFVLTRCSLSAFLGIASSMLNIATYSLASLIWPKEVHAKVAMLEAFSGVGLILGPLMGSAIYTWLGFKMSFIVMGVALLPLAFVIYCFLRSKTIKEDDADDDFFDASGSLTNSGV